MPLNLSGCGNMRSDIIKATEIAKSWGGQGDGLTKINAMVRDQGVMVPPQILANSSGICFLFFIRAGMMWSGELGTGFVISKLNPGTPDQRWSAPTAITAGGIGFGALIGAQKVSHVVILNSPRVVTSFASNAKVNFGADVGVAAGPVGRNVDAKLAAGDRGISATYSYSYSQGLYAGIQLDGMVVTQNPTMNQNFYGSKQNPKSILNGEAGLDAWQFCPELANLYQVLDASLNQAAQGPSASIFGHGTGPSVARASSAVRQQADDLFSSFGSSRRSRGPAGPGGVDLMGSSRPTSNDTRRSNPYDDLYDSREYEPQRYDEYDRNQNRSRDDYSRGRYPASREYDGPRRDNRDYYDDPPQRSNYDDYGRNNNAAYRVADDDEYDYDRRREDRRARR